jgi:uncharacterized damage-inducible protein DinB
LLKIIDEKNNYRIHAIQSLANEKICSYLELLSNEQLDLEQRSSFTSIRKTTEHIADCEFNWLKRIHGDSNWEFKAEAFHNVKELAQFWLEQSVLFAKMGEQADEDSLQKIIECKNRAGTPLNNELFKILMHVMNHSTYHRGQLVTMLRGAGFTQISSTDLITFYRL